MSACNFRMFENGGKAASILNGKAKASATAMAVNILLDYWVSRTHTFQNLARSTTDFYLVNMPELTAQTNMDASSVQRLKEELSKFTVWLSRNSERYFVAKYEKPENAVA